MTRILAVLLLCGCGGVDGPAERMDMVGTSQLAACPARGETRAELQARLGQPDRYCVWPHAVYAQWPEDRTIVSWTYAYALIWPQAQCGGQAGQLCAWLEGDLGPVASMDMPCVPPDGGLCQAFAPPP